MNPLVPLWYHDEESKTPGGQERAGADRRLTAYPTAPDGRYFIVRGRLWRTSDPALPADRRAALVKALMAARRAMGQARKAGDRPASAEAKAAVDAPSARWANAAPFGGPMARRTGTGTWRRTPLMPIGRRGLIAG